MKKTLLAISTLLLLAGCKEKIEKFIFDASQMSTLSEYSYEYKSNKLIASKEITYHVMFGQKVDTMETLTTYEYDNKGLLKKKLSKTYFEELPSVRLFEYNSNDSLIREMEISPEKDTIYWDEYNCFPDGRKLIYRRFIHRHSEPNQDLLAFANTKDFDTIVHRMVYQYENNICKSSKEYDGKNNLTRIVEYDYDNDKLMKETYVSLIKSIELTESTKYYNYSKSDQFPDYCSLSSTNDTIGYCKNVFINDSLYSTTTVSDYGKMADKTFYKNGKIIGMIDVNKEMNFKITEAYSYYENGDLKEIKSCSEEITK